MNVSFKGNQPYIIGITGPIGSGKSLVRKMLEHMGALTIDADHLAHCAYDAGTTGYFAVIDRFGKQILDENGRVDRKALGKLVFEDQSALGDLEAITHPLVTKAVKRISALSPLPIIIVEAIKLFESDLISICDAIWLVDAPEKALIDRLQSARGMPAEDVKARLEQQADFFAVNKPNTSTLLNDSDCPTLWEKVKDLWQSESRKTDRFNKAVQNSEILYQPFTGSLIHPSMEIVEKVKGKMPIGENHEQIFIFLITHLVWTTRNFPDGNKFIIANMERRNLQINHIHDRLDRGTLFSVMEKIEQFAHLHLCSHIDIPLEHELEAFMAEIGYDRYTNIEDSRKESHSVKYNRFRKVLQPNLNLFREK